MVQFHHHILYIEINQEQRSLIEKTMSPLKQTVVEIDLIYIVSNHQKIIIQRLLPGENLRKSNLK